jgi:hypothetical protein
MRLPRTTTFGIFFCALFLDYQLHHQSGVSAGTADSLPSKKSGTSTRKKRSLTAPTTMAQTTSNMRQRKHSDASFPAETRGGSSGASSAVVSSGDSASTLSKIRRTIFPIYGSEVTKFLLIGSIKVSAYVVHVVKQQDVICSAIHDTICILCTVLPMHVVS